MVHTKKKMCQEYSKNSKETSVAMQWDNQICPWDQQVTEEPGNINSGISGERIQIA